MAHKKKDLILHRFGMRAQELEEFDAHLRSHFDKLRHTDNPTQVIGLQIHYKTNGVSIKNNKEAFAEELSFDGEGLKGDEYDE